MTMAASNERRERAIQKLIARFGEFKKVVRMRTGVAYKVPTRDISRRESEKRTSTSTLNGWKRKLTRRRIMVNCSSKGCRNNGKYALYEFHENLTKIWRTDLCEEHEKFITKRNTEIRKGRQTNGFMEVHEHID